MVPCLHQSNLYIKKKLWVWRVKKCIPIVVQKPHLPVRDCKRPRLMWACIGPENGNLRISGSMVLCLHQSNVYIKRKLRGWRVQKCIPLVGAKSALTSAGLQTTLSHVTQYRAENGNLRKSRSSFSYGTMFAPKQSSYQKEATGTESPKMYSSSWCKNRTYVCWTANDPVSSKPA